MAVQQNMNSDEVKTYSNFAGADIIVMINDVVFGELQAITYAVHREVAPLYALGSANPRGFAKNKRGISGTIVFLVFDKDSLLGAVKSSKLQFKDWGFSAKANLYSQSGQALGWSNYNNAYNPANWNEVYTGLQNQDMIKVSDLFTRLTADNIRYADQIPPFTITISMANEYGAAASMGLYGVQIINEGSGLSIDDLTSEKACTFVATDFKPLSAMGENSPVFNK
jgi:hypothetical protein